MKRHLALAVVVALLVAGCNALGPTGGPSGPAGTETVTPVPVGSDPGTGTAPATLSLPPGVTAEGEVTPPVLLAAHRKALDGEGFTATVRYERVGPGDGVADNFTDRVAVDGNGTILAERVSSANRTQVLYIDGSNATRRVTVDNRTIEAPLSGPVGPEHVLATGDAVRQFLDVDGATVRSVDRDGETYVRVHATDPPAEFEARHSNRTVINYTATAYVAPNGFIRALAVDYGYALGDHHVDISLRIDYSRESVTVDRPEWVTGFGNATAQRGESNATVRTPGETAAGTEAADAAGTRPHTATATAARSATATATATATGETTP